MFVADETLFYSKSLLYIFAAASANPYFNAYSVFKKATGIFSKQNLHNI
jgi:hypothetical protein